MNIKILDSWLREYLKTKARPERIAECMSLSSVSIERIEKLKDDYVYDIEITTNRPDLMSVIGLAREAAAVLPQFDIKAKFIAPKITEISVSKKLDLEIKNDSHLVNRICAVALEVELNESSKIIQERLLASEINTHNNVIDVTNYVMREVGHPIHAFDLDRLLETGKMIIRESKKGERIKTLDEINYELEGGDIVIDNGKGEIIDLVGIKGTANSSISQNTKRVLLFVDNNDPARIRKTSMGLAIRSDAAQLNEKGVDRALAREALLRGAELLTNMGAKVISELVDIYPNKIEGISISITEEKISSTIGITIPVKTCIRILKDLGFEVSQNGSKIIVRVPSERADVSIEEDLIEEVARVYGYHKLPSILPTFDSKEPYNPSGNTFYIEGKIKNALKFFGFTEIYTYSLVSEDMLEVAPSEAVTLKNPLSNDHVYMRTTLVPSLLCAARENKARDELALFELANVYIKREGKLPDERLKLAGIYKNPKMDILEVKGIIEALLEELGIENVEFAKSVSGALGMSVKINGKYCGEIEKLEADLVDFELDYETIFMHINLKKAYKPISKFPEAIEDLRFEIDKTVAYVKIVKAIKEQSDLIKEVRLLDEFENKKTFRVIYQSYTRNLTNEDLMETRNKIITALKKSFKAEPV